ncbi:MAG: hypothetical protein H6625_09965 [Bdellovibrionaceae bacterium]|nr:hypothetical protein [Pseudobdellovibrionaceae bacterium]
MKTSIQIFLLFIICLPQVSWAKGNKSKFAVTTYYSTYDDVSLSDTESKVKLPPSLDVELTLRLMSIFNIALTAKRFIHDENSPVSSLSTERQSFGLGLKVDLPGIFFVGGSSKFASLRGKNWPVNSFFYGIVQQVASENASGSTDKAFATSYGLGMDVFLFNEIAYLSLHTGGFQFENNTFFQLSGGLGATF